MNRAINIRRLICAVWLVALGLILPLFLPAHPVQAGTFEVNQAAHARLSDRLQEAGAHALVIGISEFDDRGWSDLPGVLPEVREVSDALARQGFRVERPRDDGRLTRDELRATIQRFVRTHGQDPDARLVIYIASHGNRDPRREGYGLIVASDSAGADAPDFVAGSYSVSDLSFDLLDIQTRNLFLFINACFSGAMVPVAQATDRSATSLNLDDSTETWASRLLDRGAKLVLTAGSDDQLVPDQNNPFARAVISGLNGEADRDGDGLILGTELAYHVRERVARETIRAGAPNDPYFALLPGQDQRATLQGDFLFLAPDGPRDQPGGDTVALLKARQDLLPASKFTECVDCPVMVELPAAPGGTKLALAETETTFAAWDACYREFGCRRYLPAGARGRGDQPVFGITWQDALEFVAWVDSKAGDRCQSYRLPDPDEWRAASGALFSGRDLSTGAVCRDCDRFGGRSARQPGRAGGLPANIFGLHEMTGNLWEWVSAKGAECSVSDLLSQPRCQTDGLVIGGSYATRAKSMSRAHAAVPMPRTSNQTPFSLPTVGFRVACELQ